MMSEETNPVCIVCKTTTSLTWKKNSAGQFTCGRCSLGPVTVKRTNIRKSTRAKSSRCRQSKIKEIIKGKSRRDIVFKKNPPVRSLRTQATTVTLDYLIYEKQLYQLGDIVSMLHEDNTLKYGQIIGMAIDEFGEKSAYIRWLKPVVQAVIFEPQDYIIDYEDKLPRKFQFLNFVSHAPTYLFPKPNESDECNRCPCSPLKSAMRMVRQGSAEAYNMVDGSKCAVNLENVDKEGLGLNQEVHGQIDVDVQQKEVELVNLEQENEVPFTELRCTIPSSKYCASSSEVECTSCESSST